jgi:hypothetical protein
MIGSPPPVCYPQIGASHLLLPRAHVSCLPLEKHIRRLGEHQDCRGGTAARRDGVRVFKQFTWLEAGSGKMVLSHPAHQYP